MTGEVWRARLPDGDREIVMFSDGAMNLAPITSAERRGDGVTLSRVELLALRRVLEALNLDD